MGIIRLDRRAYMDIIRVGPDRRLDNKCLGSNRVDKC